MNTKAIGEITEAVILEKLISKGYAVSIPFGNNQRYDLIVDREGKLIKGQCKTGRLRNGIVQFNTFSTNGFTGLKRNYQGEIDVFWIYCPDNKKCYEIPINKVPLKSEGRLRIVELKHKQSNYNIKWAKDFEM